MGFFILMWLLIFILRIILLSFKIQLYFFLKQGVLFFSLYGKCYIQENSLSHGNSGCSNNICLLLFTIVIAYQALHIKIYMGTFASIYINTYTETSPQYLQANISLTIFSQIYNVFFPPWELDLHNDGTSFILANSILYYSPKGIILSALSNLLLCLIKVAYCETNFSCSLY